ncbi:hypothetical protein ACQ3G6_13110 [Allorhizobium undicola]|uniref:hypothetical protein n=1 Tax=Allorhizobium undicola TaxID=78527 RepID=UPI0004843D6F|nr:hypothetical protein [Allorhizobium undicola]
MSVFRKVMTAGLVAVSLAAAMTPAAAHDRFWGGVAAGALGGIVGGALIAGAERPAYAYEPPPPPPPPRVVYRTYYQPVYVPPCHTEWRENEWGDSYRVRVCPR